MRRRLLVAVILVVLAQLGLWMMSGVARATPPDSAEPVKHALSAPGEEWTDTDTGPLGPADRDLLVRVRTAGLWEGPAGEMAQARAASDRVREVGQHLRADHTALDVRVRMVAEKLRVELPDTPTAEQRGWLNELSSRRGAEFDVVFADRLRAAHGKVFAIVAAVRAGTRNDTIRDFAQTANTVVMKHMTLLESTGLVDFDALPTPPVAAPASRAAGRINPSLAWLVLGLAVATGLVTLTRVIRPR